MASGTRLLTQQDFLDLFDRILPQSYVGPLKNPGPGYEVLQAYAAMMARLSLAINHLETGAFVLSSPGASFAVAPVTLQRSDNTNSILQSSTGPVTLNAPDSNGTQILGTLDGQFQPYSVGNYLVMSGSMHAVNNDTFVISSLPVATPVGTVVGIHNPFGVAELFEATWQEKQNNTVKVGTVLQTQYDGRQFQISQDVTFGMKFVQLSQNSSVTFSAPASSTGLQTVSGLSGLTADSVGRSLVIVSTSALSNQGTFPILSVAGPTTATIFNVAGLAASAVATVWSERIINELGPLPTTATALFAGYDFNVPGPLFDLNGRPVLRDDGTQVPGDIQTIVKPVQDPPYGDPTITVTQTGPATGGVNATLEQLGSDRGVVRHDGESVPAYRQRIMMLPDTITPAAMLRLGHSIFDPLKQTFSLIETFDPTYQTAYDCTNGDAVPGPNTFVYDDPRSKAPFRNRWLDWADERGAFIFVVPNLPSITEYGVAFDDPAVSILGLTTPLGHRAVPAFDLPDASPLFLVGAMDGTDPGKQTVYKKLYDSMQAIKATGVDASLELLGQ